MRKVKGSICSVCYALKGNYARYKATKAAMEFRFASLTRSDWVNTMVELIARKEKSGYFRWHDSGDLQSVEHLTNIVEIAKRIPHIKFWLPTREYNIVSDYIKAHRRFPENLTVRLSGLMLDGLPPNARQNPHCLPTSGAVKEGYNCPASEQGNKCLDCRLCWDSTVHVNYRKH
jgi:hypothetical protein